MPVYVLALLPEIAVIFKTPVEEEDRNLADPALFKEQFAWFIAESYKQFLNYTERTNVFRTSIYCSNSMIL